MVKNYKVEKNLIDEKSGEISVNEKRIDDFEQMKSEKEKTDLIKEEIENKKAREEIENMDLDDSLNTQVSAQASKIQSLDEQKKIKHLLKIAKEKGVIFAVNVVKKMNDPYILDMFHDALAKNGYYKEFLK